MAYRVQQELRVGDVLGDDRARASGLDPDEMRTYVVIYRLEIIESIRGGDFTLKYRRYAQDPTTDEVFEITQSPESDIVSFGDEPKDPIPPEDILNPETGEVDVPKGDYRQKVPRKQVFKQQPLANPQGTLQNQGDLIRYVNSEYDTVWESLHPSRAGGDNPEINNETGTRDNPRRRRRER